MISPAALTLWTWVAIVVLVVGSLAVFVWFLRDASRLMRSLKDGEDEVPRYAASGRYSGKRSMTSLTNQQVGRTRYP